MIRRAFARAWPYVAVAAVAALAFARGPFSGHPLYFRDLSLYFFPLRGYVLEGLRGGVLRFWNPYIHEGEPLALPPVSYPLDLLQLLRPDETGMSVVLALHLPLAAVWMMALARRGLRLPAAPSAAAAVVYALGGFALSTVNLYVHAQALAWAPAVVLGLMRVPGGGRRTIAIAALAVGILLSTTAAEIAAQAIGIGLLLALPCSAAGVARLAAALGLGAGLAAPVALVVARVAADSARAAGFPAEVVLSHSIHPLTFAQVVVAGFHGDPAHLVERWWGANFFPRGFPYFLSLYLGSAAIVAAAFGIAHGRGPRRRLALLAAAAALVALGRWGAGEWIVEAFDLARRFRYPSKAFFSVHLAVALLAGLGVDAAGRIPRGWRRLAVACAIGGAVLATAPLWPRIAPARARWFAAGFFPPEVAASDRLALLDWVLRDAAIGGAVSLAVAAVALLAWRGRLGPAAAAAGISGLLAADLLRAGAGLNPTVPQAFFSPSPEMAPHHAAWRESGRVFTCHPGSSRAYALGRAVRPDHERWTFAVLRDTLVPAFNMRARVPSAMSADLTMLVSPERVIDPADAGCADIADLIPVLKAAGVAHVISADPLSHDDLRPEAAEYPSALAPLAVFAYRLRDPLPMIAMEGARGARAMPRASDPGHIAIDVTTDAPSTLVVREAGAAGWTAAVDGRASPVVAGRHLAVAVPAGTHVATFDYEPPGLRVGALVGLVAALVTLGLAAWPRRRSREPGALPSPAPAAPR